jgi:hypothetical protein
MPGTPTPTSGPTPTPAPTAYLDKGQQACVNQMNKNGEKVSKAQLKDHEKCLKDHQKGNLTTDFEVCITDDRKGKVGKAQVKTMVGEAKKCGPLTEPPPFAYTNAATVNQHAVDGALALTHAIFGGPPVQDADLATAAGDKDTARCQLAMLKEASKLENTVLKEANKAKKTALKKGMADSASALAVELERSFSNGKLTTVEGKLAQKVSKVCAGLGSPDTIFPGACADPVLRNLSVCVIAAARCQACLGINAMDDLALDCDDLDDGNTVNGSCL